MAAKHALEELNNCSREELITMILMMQGQLDALNENIEKLIEQVRIANSYRFGKHTETLDSIDGQLSFFDEAESCCDLSAPEPAEEEVIPSRRRKKKGQRETDLIVYPKKNWITFTEQATGADWRMKPIKGCGMSRNPGRLKCTP